MPLVTALAFDHFGTKWGVATVQFNATAFDSRHFDCNGLLHDLNLFW